MSAEVCLVHGAPGCGKTHTLLDAVERHKEQDGIDIWDFYMANFTNNGREATGEDLLDRGVFDLASYPDDIDEGSLEARCRTLHSIALSCCPEVPQPKEQVITMDDNADLYEAFCRQHGLDFEPDETNPMEMVQTGKEPARRGNKLFALDQWLHARYLPSADRSAKVSKAPVDIELSNSVVRELLEEWATFKRGRSPTRYEHHDYVDLALGNGYVPDVRLLCIDEFQDLSPVEYALYKQWRDSGTIDWIYIAGDVNQSIYSFRCASPLYLSETDVDKRKYLTESYRCPQSVSAVARGILEAEESITRNVFETAQQGGRTPTGQAQMRTLDEDDALAAAVRSALAAHDEPAGEDEAVVYLLTRTNYQLGILSTALQRQGVPFDAIGDKMDPWPDHVVECLLALRALRRGTPAPKEAAETLLNAATNTDRRIERLNTIDLDAADFRADLESDPVIFPEQLEAAFPGRSARTIVDVLDLTDYQQAMLRGALESNAAPYPERVQVGTIHEAKGLEAPCVFLFAEATANIRDRYRSGEGRAEEHRIAYVGATRAAETLYVVDGYFNGPTSPIFADGLPGHTEPDDAADGAQEVAD